MEQHPVPQDITGFKFKLVGDMTLKQFGELAFGAIIAYLFYATSWPGFIKLPLTIMFGFLGFALAFLPIEERPLDIWIVNFLKAIYRPTLYVWQKSSGAVLFSPPPLVSPATTPITPIPTWTPPEETPAKPTTQPVETAQPLTPKSPLSIEDLQKLRDQKTKELEDSQKKMTKAVKEVRTDTFQAQNAPRIVTVDSLAMRRDEKKLEEETTIRNLIKQNNDLLAQIETVKTKIQALQGMDTTQLQQQLNNLSSQREALAAQIGSMQATARPVLPPPETNQPIDPSGIRIVEKPVTRQATVSLTDVPNIINGLVVNNKNVPLDSTILIIKDKDGNSIRALKTNQVGQFIASTPLENGTYYLEFERLGYTFDILEITLSGKVITPLEIRAKPAVSAETPVMPSTNSPVGTTKT